MSWDNWSFAFNVTAPNLLMLLLGVFLRRVGLMNDDFCHSASRLVFTLALPCLLFFSLAGNHSGVSGNLPLAIYGAFATVATFLLLELVAPKLVSNPQERGIFVQGGFRANTAIVGLAYCANAYGSEGVAIGSLYMAATVLLFNVLSVVTLTRSLRERQNRSNGLLDTLKGIIKNPLIISIALGLLYDASQLPVPKVMSDTGHLLSGLALPLALLCTGASLDLKAMRSSSGVAMHSSLAKLIVIPLIMTFGGWLYGFRGIPLGIIFLFSSTPTAAASYVMVRAMGGNATLAANIIAVTTFGSFFTTSVGLYLLRHWNII